MNEWSNNRINKQMNYQWYEWTNEWMKEQIINEQVRNEQISE
jgi:hypothetical protein